MKLLSTILVLVFMSSCIKLDDIAFYNETVTEYQYDHFNGDIDFVLDSNFNVSDIHEFNITSDGYSLSSVYIGEIADIPNDTIILYCHGQTGHMDYYWQRAKLLANCGFKNRFGVYTFDDRGFGMSEGVPTEKGMYEDVRAAYDWLINAGSNPNNIILYGFSLGSAPATDLSAYGQNGQFPLKLILESPFASADFLAQESTLIQVSASYVTNLEFDNVQKISLVQQPLMWMHGTEDDYVAITNGEAIVANYSGTDTTFIRVIGAQHGKNGVPQTMGYENYLQALEEFITKP